MKTIRLLARYFRWLHTRWPAGRVERLPLINDDGSTNVSGLYIVGDITGTPLLKFSSHTGARAVQTISNDPAFQARDQDVQRDGKRTLDLVIIGAGVSGLAAAIEAKQRGLRFEILEASEPFSTIVNFPKGKSIFTYPTDMVPAGDLQFTEKSKIKEGLVEELHEVSNRHGIQPQIVRIERVERRGGLLDCVMADGDNLTAHRVVVGIGRSGNFRRLGVPGEDLDKVYNRLHDPKDFCGHDVLVVGGGDSALESAIALATSGGAVTLSYRKDQFSRPKLENVEKIQMLQEDPMAEEAVVEKPSSDRVTTAVGAFLNEYRVAGSIRMMMSSHVKQIRSDDVVITNSDGQDETIPNRAVFSMIGREPPLEFFRRSGVYICGEWRLVSYVTLTIFLAFCVFLYHWKESYGLPVKAIFEEHHWFPFNLVASENPANLFGTIQLSMLSPSFYYSLVYCFCIAIFGIQRIKRRKTPYVKVQTLTLMAIQCIPLFLLPYILLPWAGHNGVFDAGTGKAVADALFPVTQGDVQGREYWRSAGFILAWPLMIWNVFTDEPIWAWLVIGFVQTFVIIPLIIRKWGKGAYCGWICSCGALAETMGDAHRHKMVHGPIWNRMNMIGQVFLFLATVLLVLRIVLWIMPDQASVSLVYNAILNGKHADGSPIGGVMTFFNYAWGVDLLWAGIFGVAFYFWFSGRVWCRFACPLAALMHIYARFSRFRIISEKKKCISCNVCTSVCHQGIDVMNFANKGVPMEDPQCVRCSACVQSCPTGVLTFGQVDRQNSAVIKTDSLPASSVQMAELTVNGKQYSDRSLNRKILVTAAVLFLAMGAAIWAVALGSESRATLLSGLVAQTQPAPMQPETQPATSQPAPAPASESSVEDLPGVVPGPHRDLLIRSGITGKNDHSDYNAILMANVHDQLVDYLAIRKNHYGTLRAYLDRLAQIDPDQMSRDEQLAFYINLYNATMIRTVVERFRAGYQSDENRFRVFDEPIVRLRMRNISLNHLEHKIIRRKFNEPRIHVALVCAARSCPPLIARAYRGGDLEAMLESSMKRFVAEDPFRNRVDANHKELQLSHIFNWYADDFGGKRGRKAYVDRYHPRDLSGFKEVGFVDYSWKLNIAPPADGRWARVIARTPLLNQPGGRQVSEAEMDEVYEVLQETDGHVLLSRPLQGDTLWLPVKSIEAYLAL